MSPRRTWFGDGTAGRLARILRQTGSTSVFLVTGGTSFAASGSEAALAPALAGLDVQRFSGFAVNPQVDDLRRGLSEFRRRHHDTLVAVGGGSVLDMGKLIAVSSKRSFLLHFRKILNHIFVKF